jgi:hypothetical protein
VTAPAGASGNRWRLPALTAQWLYVAASLGLTAYTLLPGLNEGTVVTGLRSLLAALVGAWWAVIFGRYLLGQGTPDTDGTLRALRIFFPWLTALRLSLWLIGLLALSGNVTAEVNPVALTALQTLSFGYIFAKNAVYGTLARYATDPANALGRRRLGEWLNVAAPLALAIGVINTVPLGGVSEGFRTQDVVMYGVHAALDLLALGLSLLALREMQTPVREREA